jgi:hypothetical protein
VSTLLRDGEPVVASAYSNRVIKIPLVLTTATEDTAAAAVRALSHQLDKPTNTLRVKLGTTQVFFRTMRSSFALAMARNLLRDGAVTLELPAEPFGYGEEETAFTGNVASDPAAGTNPCYVDVANPKGDVPAPVIVKHGNDSLWSSSATMTAVNVLYAVRRHGTPGSGVWYRQAESFTMGGTAITNPANDAAFSGAGNNSYLFTNPSSTSTYTFLSGPMMGSTANADIVGTYRVLALVRPNSGSTDFRLKLSWGYLNSHVNAEAKVATSTGGSPPSGVPILVDLGLVTVGSETGYGPKASWVRSAKAPDLTLYVRSTVSNTATLNVDYLLYVPADEDLAIAQYNLWPSVSHTSTLTGAVADGHLDMAYMIDNSLWMEASMAALVGRIPSIAQDRTNRLFIVPGLNRDAPVSKTWAVTVSYFPRYIVVPGATT